MGLRDVAQAVALSTLLGMTVGIVSDMLHPVRQKIPVLTDFIISVWLIWVWLIIAFDICAGDLRAGECVVAALGAIGWRIWISPMIRPVFSKIWAVAWRIFRFLFIPLKFFGKNLKFFEKYSFQQRKNGLQ